jgi:hypothetical protein
MIQNYYVGTCLSSHFGFPEDDTMTSKRVAILCFKYDLYSFYVFLFVTVFTFKDKARNL